MKVRMKIEKKQEEAENWEKKESKDKKESN